MLNPLLNLINNKTFTKSFSTCSLLLVLTNTVIASPETDNNSKKVRTSSYADIKVNVTHTLGGVVPAAQNSAISAQISAIINTFHVDTGYKVNKGDLLVTLDCRENKLRLKQAAANYKAEKVQLEHAIIQFNQAKKLSTQGNISKELYNQREAEEHRLKATLENGIAAQSLSQINVDRCQIKAPYDGYITNRFASIGELTQIGTALLQLVSKTNDIVEVKINNLLLNNFSHGKNF